MDSEDSENSQENTDLSQTKEEAPAAPAEKQIMEEKQEKQPEAQQKPASTPMSVKEWLSALHWSTNPFTFNINPYLFVGYKQQTERILMSLEEKHKFLLILGPTGSGKTTLLKWLQSRLNNFDILYVGKPPLRPEEFVDILNEKYRRPWYAFWASRIESVYQIPDFLNRKLKKKHLVVLFDESHEANTEVLEWLRVLNDQIEKMSVVLSGLPNFEDQLRHNLETFMKRVTAKIELLSLTKEETKELISKRIQYVGGTGDEISQQVIESVYHYTGGFPREIIRVCDELVNNAIAKGKTTIEFDLHEKREERTAEKPAAAFLNKMTPMQREILEMLSKKPLTPGQIANSLQLEKYKSRQHAVRSVNNVVKALHESGYLERRKEEKAFVYSLSPRISTLFVKR